MTELHLRPACCGGQKCTFRVTPDQICGKPTTHKIGEEIFDDDPEAALQKQRGLPEICRHNLTAYLCCEHFAQVLGPAATQFVCGPLTAATPAKAPTGGIANSVLYCDECKTPLQRFEDGGAFCTHCNFAPSMQDTFIAFHCPTDRVELIKVANDAQLLCPACGKTFTKPT